MTMKTAYRIRIARDRADRTYIVRADSGRVDYMSGSGVPLALSNLVGCAATELRFQKDGKGALARVTRDLEDTIGHERQVLCEAVHKFSSPKGFDPLILWPN